MLNREEKEYILNEYLRHISHMVDKEYQKRIWIRGEGPECQAFDDFVCYFFEVGDGVLEEYKEFGITEAQYHILKRLRDEFDAFPNRSSWPQEFIDTPEWEKIINLAKEVLEAFHYQKK